MVKCIYCDVGEFKAGLCEEEVKEYFKEIYGKNWHNKLRSFKKFMEGQTVMRSILTGKTLFYRQDVLNFMRPKKDRYFD